MEKIIYNNHQLISEEMRGHEKFKRKSKKHKKMILIS